LIARASGTTLSEFLRERIFDPLGMEDTAFHVPPSKLDRFATAYVQNRESQQLNVFDDPVTGKFAKPPVFENAGAGLVSIVEDFNAFAQMMLNGGRLGSTRILSRPSVELMTTDHLAPEQKLGSELFFGDNRGWVLGFRCSAGATICTMCRAASGGRRLRHLLVFRSKGAAHRNPVDAASDGFAGAAAGDDGFLGRGLSGHRRLKRGTSRHSLCETGEGARNNLTSNFLANVGAAYAVRLVEAPTFAPGVSDLGIFKTESDDAIHGNCEGQQG